MQVVMAEERVTNRVIVAEGRPRAERESGAAIRRSRTPLLTLARPFDYFVCLDQQPTL
ncbi:hypothetical protein AKJ09_04643 [Labilithrix luteola]|uniref:Uncharacterized protein n=1 Tax=Labilithrix luteola TaxID=1391654 RepID=A0A0K1PXV4_9BACT|nr:hypothetical protein AKJ09_04643 [Labilithrix luteola]